MMVPAIPFPTTQPLSLPQPQRASGTSFSAAPTQMDTSSDEDSDDDIFKLHEEIEEVRKSTTIDEKMKPSLIGIAEGKMDVLRKRGARGYNSMFTSIDRCRKAPENLPANMIVICTTRIQCKEKGRKERAEIREMGIFFEN
jgi:hypothetical protein